MLKLFCPTLILSSTLIFLTTEVTFSQPSSENSSSPVVPTSSTDLPVCYIQTEAGTFLDLSSVCGKAPAQNVSKPVGITREEIIDSFIYKKVTNDL